MPHPHRPRRKRPDCSASVVFVELAFLAVLLAGCPPTLNGVDGPRSGDESGFDEAGSDVGPSDDGDLRAVGTVPCDHGAGEVSTADVYVVEADGNTTISVDTVDALTTFDPWSFTTRDLDGFTWDYLFSGDDDFDCTFPPPDFSCPEYTDTGSVGAIAITVLGYVDNCNASGTGAYELSVRGLGPEAELVFVGDDVELLMN